MNQTKKLGAGIVWIAVIVSVIVSVLALVGKLRAHQSALVFIWVGVFYALALYYGLKGYQRPHGTRNK